MLMSQPRSTQEVQFGSSISSLILPSPSTQPLLGNFLPVRHTHTYTHRHTQTHTHIDQQTCTNTNTNTDTHTQKLTDIRKVWEPLSYVLMYCVNEYNSSASLPHLILIMY